MFPRAVNHIHCIRSNCNYVLHSSGQLYSHKRKHERRDNDDAYRKYNGNNNCDNGGGGHRPPSISSVSSESSSTPPLYKQDGVPAAGPCSAPPQPPPGGPLSLATLLGKSSSSSTETKPGGIKPPTAFNPYTHPQPPPAPPPPPFGSSLPPGIPGPGAPPLPNAVQAAMFGQQTLMMTDLLRDKIPDEVWRDYMLHFESGEGCGFQGCEVDDAEHFHCKDEGCETVFRSEEGVWEHGRNHFVQDKVRMC